MRKSMTEKSRFSEIDNDHLKQILINPAAYNLTQEEYQIAGAELKLRNVAEQEDLRQLEIKLHKLREHWAHRILNLVIPVDKGMGGTYFSSMEAKELDLFVHRMKHEQEFFEYWMPRSVPIITTLDDLDKERLAVRVKDIILNAPNIKDFDVQAAFIRINNITSNSSSNQNPQLPLPSNSPKEKQEDLLQNLIYLCSETSMYPKRSKQILQNPHIKKLAKCDLKNDRGQVTLTVKCRTNGQATKMIRHIKSFLTARKKANLFPKSEITYIQIFSEGKNGIITATKDQLDKLCAYLSKDAIIEFCHPNDYKAYLASKPPLQDGSESPPRTDTQSSGDNSSDDILQIPARKSEKDRRVIQGHTFWSHNEVVSFFSKPVRKHPAPLPNIATLYDDMMKLEKFKVADTTYRIAWFDKWGGGLVTLRNRSVDLAPYLEDLSNLSHKNLVAHIGSFSQYNVELLQFAGRMSLRMALDNYREYAPKTMLSYCTQVAQAVSYLHKNGILHLELDSDQFMLCGDGTQLKLLPPTGEYRFDINKSNHSSLKGDELDRGEVFLMGRITILNGDNHLIGNPLYIPREIFMRRKRYGSKTDSYAAGIIFYEIITRKHPHNELHGNIEEIKQKVVSDEHAKIAPIQGSTSKLNNVCKQLLWGTIQDRAELRDTLGSDRPNSVLPETNSLEELAKLEEYQHGQAPKF